MFLMSCQKRKSETDTPKGLKLKSTRTLGPPVAPKPKHDKRQRVENTTFVKVPQRVENTTFVKVPQRVENTTFFKVPQRVENTSFFKVTQLSQGQTVYIPDPVKAWIPAVVVNVLEGFVHVQNVEKQIVTVECRDVLLRSADQELGTCDNLTDVTPINNAAVVDCLHERFSADMFYTLAGSTIVALNPFKEVPQLYTWLTIKDYHREDKLLQPHIYQIASQAYTDLVRGRGHIDQSIVVSGESGAGKTVSAKHLLRYLTVVSSPDHVIHDTVMAGNIIERRVLDSNPILEAFGNAVTPRNENSSRFGKFIQLQFDRGGRILGGVIKTYLLEKTRVNHQGEGESNFHIFYQLFSLKDEKNIPLWLETVKKEVVHSGLSCFNQQQGVADLSIIIQDCEAVSCQDSSLSVTRTVEAMEVIGIPQTAQVHIFQLLLAVLHLTQLVFVSARDEDCSLIDDGQEANDEAELLLACHWSKCESSRLLGVSSLDLHQSLLHRKIVSGSKTRQSVFVKPLNVTEAQSRRDCLAMLIYARIFDWLVTFINNQIRAEKCDRTINLLDIYGFETLDVNSLEQLCINYANERLQQHYVTHFLKDLQIEYQAEKIPWINICYKDNCQCVEALDSPTSVFGVLNEEVSLNRKSEDKLLCDRIVATDKSQLVHRRVAGTCTQFVVQHYAGPVIYSVEGVAHKNKDAIPTELISLLKESQNSFLAELFSGSEFTCTEQSLTPTKAKKKNTVLTKFKSSLDQLMSSLQHSDVHYIRCIKPNAHSQPHQFDCVYVLHQLQACGTLETVDISRRGYPARMTYLEFAQRYGLILNLRQHSKLYPHSCLGLQDTQLLEEHRKEIERYREEFVNCVYSHVLNLYENSCMPVDQLQNESAVSKIPELSLKACALIIARTSPQAELDQMICQFGMQKIFITQAQLESLEHIRASIFAAAACCLQTSWHARCQRHYFMLLKSSTVIVQAHWRAYFVRRKLAVMRAAAVSIQTSLRACLMRRQFVQMRAASVIVQTAWRGHSCHRKFVAMKCAAHTIEQAWRKHKLLKCLRKLVQDVRIVKRFLRAWIKQRRLHRLAAVQADQFRLCQVSTPMYRTSLLQHACRISPSSCIDSASSIAFSHTSFTECSKPDSSGYSSAALLESVNKNYLEPDHSLTEITSNLDNSDPSDVHMRLDGMDDNDDSLSVMSDDSGVMIKEEMSSSVKPCPHLKIGKENVYIDRGIITCRRLTKPGHKFHTKPSLLPYAHVIHSSLLPLGLPDALPD